LSEAEAPTHSEENVATEDNQGERRGFIKFLCFVIGGIVSAVPFGAGIWANINPLTREKGVDGDGFLKITSVDAIPDDGTPAKFSVIADKEDAWNKFKNISVGAIYLRKEAGKVKALHTVCPHLGCFIDYRSTKSDFFCPCHNSNFKLDGSIVSGATPNITPSRTPRNILKKNLFSKATKTSPMIYPIDKGFHDNGIG
jgi:menaquinol-cytochrome c reductase iron-sulfur subunit